jgi:hypothetical protein
MTHYGKPEPMPYVDEDDLLQVAGELGHGVFTAASLYDWYAGCVKSEGRKPVTKVRFGLALKEAGWTPSVEYRDQVMVRCWLITKPWARRGHAVVNLPGTPLPPSLGGPPRPDRDDSSSLDPDVWDG